MSEKVELRDVTADNWQQVVGLELDPDQVELVATNEESMEESREDEDARPRAIYAGETLVGFMMYDAGRPRDRQREALIYRFMVDKKYQGAGYGRAALDAAITEIRQIPKVKKIVISYMPENPVTKTFYASFGFVETEVDEDGEMFAELML